MSHVEEFTTAPAGPLPVILLADVSGSMSTQGKIDTLNTAVKEMIETFAREDDSRAEIHVAIVTFGQDGAKQHQPLLPAARTQWQPMSASGGTPLGAALEVVTRMMEDRQQLPGRAYRPSLVLISDGIPTDEWQQPLRRLLDSERASKAARFALGIGEDADKQMLQAFLADPQARVFEAHEARQIHRFFRWVTMSVMARSRSSNPNSVAVVAPTDLDELDF